MIAVVYALALFISGLLLGYSIGKKDAEREK